MSIANELISARAERGFSQAHLAEISGVSRSAIKAYETGRNMPGSRELRALCLALNVTPNRLLFGTETPQLAPGGAEMIRASLRADPEDRAVARARLACIAELLTEDEAKALGLLARSLAVARHGAARVESAIGAADMLVGMSRTMQTMSLDAAASGAVAVEPSEFVDQLESMLLRQGHEPKT